MRISSFQQHLDRRFCSWRCLYCRLQLHGFLVSRILQLTSLLRRADHAWRPTPVRREPSRSNVQSRIWPPLPTCSAWRGTPDQWLVLAILACPSRWFWTASALSWGITSSALRRPPLVSQREKPRQTVSSLEAPITLPRTSRWQSLSMLTAARTMRSLGGIAWVGSAPGAGAPHDLGGTGGSIDDDRCGQAAAGDDRLPIGGKSIRRNSGILPKAGPCRFDRAGHGSAAYDAPLRRDLLNKLSARHVVGSTEKGRGPPDRIRAPRGHR